MISNALAMVLTGAILCALVGLGTRLYVWLKTPGHPRFALAPAPVTRLGVGVRLLREGVLFESLWRASPVTWLLGWPFHVALLLIALQHLRYLFAAWHPWIEQLAAHGHLASAVLILSLGGLWLRRLTVSRVRYVSRPSDHLWLLLLLVLATTGVVLKYVSGADVVAVKGFVRGLMSAQVNPLPASPVLWLHVLLASALIALFPFSKLLHGVAVWVNPTRASRAPAHRGQA